METVIALVLFLSILTGCAGETLTNVKSSSITPNAAQTEEAVRYTVETETCADTIQAEDGTELLAYQFEVPELEVCRADGEIVNEAETDQEEQALTKPSTRGLQTGWTEAAWMFFWRRQRKNWSFPGRRG